MNTIEDARKLLAEQDAIIEEARGRIRDICKAMIEQFGGIKVGDILPCNGYSFVGKDMKVQEMRIFRSRGDIEVVASGPIRKQDGSFSERKMGKHSRILYTENL